MSLPVSEPPEEDADMLTHAVVRARILRLVRNMVRLLTCGCDPTLALGGFPPFARPEDSVDARFAGARDLAALTCVLRSAYELIAKGKSITSRELYYMHAMFFRHQRVATCAITRACAALDVNRHHLRVLAATRGWYAGLAAEEHAMHAGAAAADAGSTNVHTLCPIPADCMLRKVRVRTLGARFILVVEKECIFRRLVEDQIWLNGMPCVLVTGCGMPDFATRAFVHALHTQLRVPVLGLSDWNPYGMAIMLCFRNGSRSREDRGAYAVPLRWIGLRHDDLATFALHDLDLQSMSGVDETKARQLLHDEFIASAAGARWRRETDLWIARREKMELEGLLRHNIEFLATTYLPDKIRSRDWI